MSWLRLIRWNNLLIILLTQLLAWWCVIVPMKETGYLLTLTPICFSLLSVSTMLIAAGGYIINDYFDIRIDAINKPEKVILEKTIPRRMAIIVHSVMNAFAILLAGIVAWKLFLPELVLFQALCTFLLWRYSTTWKRKFMIGNVVVSLMTALSIIVLIVYEPAFFAAYTVVPGWHIVAGFPDNGHTSPLIILLVFALFAFLLTWMREIVKDMEDYKGDAEDGCVTMPIQWGLKKSIQFTIGLGIAALVAILISLAYYIRLVFMLGHWTIMPVYLTMLFVAIFAWLLFIGRRLTKEHFHKASTYLKLIMVLGIGSLIIYRLQYA